MFDWPEQSQTSPTKTFLRVIELLPLIVISADSLDAGSASSVTRQCRSLLVCAVFVCPPNVTETFSPGDAVPQIGTDFSRCKTTLSPNIFGKLTSACAA